MPSRQRHSIVTSSLSIYFAFIYFLAVNGSPVIFIRHKENMQRQQSRFYDTATDCSSRTGYVSLLYACLPVLFHMDFDVVSNAGGYGSITLKAVDSVSVGILDAPG